MFVLGRDYCGGTPTQAILRLERLLVGRMGVERRRRKWPSRMARERWSRPLLSLQNLRELCQPPGGPLPSSAASNPTRKCPKTSLEALYVYLGVSKPGVTILGTAAPCF